VKAIVWRQYGPPEEALRLEEVPRPEIGADDVLVRVRAASVNPIDKVVRGRPYIIRLKTGLRRPKDIRVGRDLAGQVEAVGANVTRFRPGDEVFGVGLGSCAEYASAHEKHLASKPANVTFEDAAVTPIAGLTALQCLRDKCHLPADASVLINGAGGGVGTFAVQIAKSLGAHVTAVCGTSKVEMVRGIGADRVVDYLVDDFTRDSERHDAIVDCAVMRSLSACRRLLRPNGVYVAVGAPKLGPLLHAWLVSLTTKSVAIFMAKLKSDDLTVLAGLLEQRTVKPVIGSRLPLTGVPEALRSIEGGHTQGKIAITIDSQVP
jgi:NADPH:quinone reductase-like Zn-dependent oxidoreductase